MQLHLTGVPYAKTTPNISRDTVISAGNWAVFWEQRLQPDLHLRSRGRRPGFSPAACMPRLATRKACSSRLSTSTTRLLLAKINALRAEQTGAAINENCVIYCWKSSTKPHGVRQRSARLPDRERPAGDVATRFRRYRRSTFADIAATTCGFERRLRGWSSDAQARRRSNSLSRHRMRNELATFVMNNIWGHAGHVQEPPVTGRAMRGRSSTGVLGGICRVVPPSAVRSCRMCLAAVNHEPNRPRKDTDADDGRRSR